LIGEGLDSLLDVGQIGLSRSGSALLASVNLLEAGRERNETGHRENN
jgi:hypothetical protein